MSRQNLYWVSGTEDHPVQQELLLSRILKLTVNSLHDKMNSGTGRGQKRGQLGMGQQAGQDGAIETSSCSSCGQTPGSGKCPAAARSACERFWWGFGKYSLCRMKAPH